MTDSLRDQIAATLAHEWGPSTTWTEVAELAIREVARYAAPDTELLDFGLWLSEELRGWPMTRIDLESCIKDWKGKNPDGNV